MTETRVTPRIVCGYIVMEHNANGTTTVTVYASLDHGKPRHVYAKRANAHKVDIEPGVRLTRRGAVSQSTEVLELVTTATGQVTIRLPVGAGRVTPAGCINC
jgi:hypothetical protein